MSKKNNKNEKLKFSLSELLKNNRILIVLSLIISFGLWVWVSVEKSPITQKVITDVPVKIDLKGSIPEQLNLQIFGEQEYKVDVTVSGKKYILSGLTKDDIAVSAITNYVDNSGSKTLQLKYETVDGNDDFEIVSASTSYIEVYFDTFKQVELPLNTNFVNDIDKLLPDGCVIGDVVFSKQTVSVSGPASEINRISKAVANVTLVNKLERNTTVIPDIQLITEDNTSLTYSKIDKGEGDIVMTIPVLKTVTLPTSISFKNVPSGLAPEPLSYNIYPSTITAAIPVDLAETAKTIPIATIDFADLINGKNTFNIVNSEISDIKTVPATASRFRVTVDASEMTSKVISVPTSKIRFINTTDGFNVTNAESDNISVTVVGRPEDLEGVNADSITLTADLQENDINENTKSIMAVAAVSNNKCWVNGKFEISVSVTKN